MLYLKKGNHLFLLFLIFTNRNVAKSEFDYDEEMLDTMPTIKLLKRKPKPDHDKCTVTILYEHVL